MTPSDRVGPDAATRVVGAVLMGGASRRFGSDKALADVAGVPMGLRVVGAMREAGLDPVVAVGGDAGSDLGLITIPDRNPGEGPLQALASVLSWANSGGVLVAPCDLPQLQSSDVRLVADQWQRDPTRVACAAVDGRPSVMVACWPAHEARRLRQAVDNGARRFRDALDLLDHVGVEVEPRSVADADDPATLREILRGSLG